MHVILWIWDESALEIWTATKSHWFFACTRKQHWCYKLQHGEEYILAEEPQYIGNQEIVSPLLNDSLCWDVAHAIGYHQPAAVIMFSNVFFASVFCHSDTGNPIWCFFCAWYLGDTQSNICSKSVKLPSCLLLWPYMVKQVCAWLATAFCIRCHMVYLGVLGKEVSCSRLAHHQRFPNQRVWISLSFLVSLISTACTCCESCLVLLMKLN